MKMKEIAKRAIRLQMYKFLQAKDDYAFLKSRLKFKAEPHDFQILLEMAEKHKEMSKISDRGVQIAKRFFPGKY